MTATSERSLFDRNGELVHRFQLEMGNLGIARMEEQLTAMLDSGTWRKWRDGLGQAVFLEDEFDYFLTAIGVSREHVVKGVASLDVKARLDEHMDETRTGSESRRTIEQAREDMPNRPVEPFGLTESERKYLQTHGVLAENTKRRPALGTRVRQYRHTGTSRFSGEQVPRLERLVRQLPRLDDDELTRLAEEIKLERRRRR